MLWVLIRIAEAVLMSTHNICFYGELTKIILQLSSDTLLICSSGLTYNQVVFAAKQRPSPKCDINGFLSVILQRNCRVFIMHYTRLKRFLKNAIPLKVFEKEI